MRQLLSVFCVRLINAYSPGKDDFYLVGGCPIRFLQLNRSKF